MIKYNMILKKYNFILSNLGFKLPILTLLKRMFYVDHFYFLTINLNKLNNSKRLRSDITLEKATNEDWSFIRQNLKKFDQKDRKNLIIRYLFFISGFSGCYLGKTKDGQIVSIQWLITPDENQLITKNMGRLIPLLNKNEVMVEYMYIFPWNRGMGIFQTVNHILLNKAKEEGYKVCCACIRKDNITSINEFMNLGFKIKKMTKSYNFLGMSWRKL